MEFTSELTVKLIDSMGDDTAIVKAARVSTQGADSLESSESAGLINFLMKNRHGTPFEHNSMTFFISAPIFVFREFHRHRIGWSYNEESGRYKQLEPKFYVPDSKRQLVQTGKPGHYTYSLGTNEDFQIVTEAIISQSHAAYETYEQLLDNGIAKEVARMCLPVNIYSSMYATCNARSLMAFLSLRTKSELATFPSFPMCEIEQVAVQMENEFELLFPDTYEAYNQNGRVCP